MSGKRMLHVCAFAFGLLGFGTLAAWAAPPWGGLIAGDRMDADPNKEYLVTEAQGPWMVMACSFSGDNARKQAHDLVLELRKRYKLEAYMHQAKFEFGAAPSRCVDQFGQPRKSIYKRNKGAESVEEYAVLVGSFQTADEPAAQQMLKKVKLAAPNCLATDGATEQSVSEWQKLQRDALTANGVKGRPRGPMSQAFVTTNPILPQDYFNAKGVDEFVFALNSDKNMKYSLLDCPGKYTVRVAQFKGAVIIDQKDIKVIGKEKDFKSQLNDAGEKAEKLTEALRIKGYDAYTFHDRYASTVCVGSFDSIGTIRTDGTVLPNPQVQRVIDVFAAEERRELGKAGATLVPRQMIGLPFDIQPVPVAVPRRSLGANYSRSMLGLK